MNITEITGNPNVIINQSTFGATHQKLNPDCRPNAAEKNTGCFKDMLQRAKNIELNKLNSVNKTEKIWNSLKIDKVRTSYSRMAEQLFPVQNKESFKFSVSEGVEFYNKLSDKFSSVRSNYKSTYKSPEEFKKIDILI